MQINSEQCHILDHTAHRAAGNFFCGNSPDMNALIKLGLMKSVGHKGFVPEEYFTITEAGYKVLRKEPK